MLRAAALRGLLTRVATAVFQLFCKELSEETISLVVEVLVQQYQQNSMAEGEMELTSRPETLQQAAAATTSTQTPILIQAPTTPEAPTTQELTPHPGTSKPGTNNTKGPLQAETRTQPGINDRVPYHTG